jgi:hypothetical protein
MNATIGIDLTPFLKQSDSTTYAWMREPFVLGGWRYATNGFVAVRMPAPGEPDESDASKRFDKMAEVFTSPEFAPVPWPVGPGVFADIPCRTCDGEGLIGRVKCGECDGVGSCDCPHCGQDTDCDHCNGKGYVNKGNECPTCDGKSHFQQERHQMVGELAVRGDFAVSIRALPNVRWAGNDKDKIHFLFDGGEGVIMSFQHDRDWL